jgi:hypothetical protein
VPVEHGRRSGHSRRDEHARGLPAGQQQDGR